MRALLLVLLLAGTATAQELRSGYDDAGPQVRAMQDDDMANPDFLWVRRAGGAARGGGAAAGP